MLRAIPAPLLAMVMAAAAGQAAVETGTGMPGAVPAAMARKPVLLAASEIALAAPTPYYELRDLPRDYEYAFGEARHNPNRGERSAAGRASMNRIWTDDVSARLVNPEAGTYGLRVRTSE
ncbi:hypothetical protein [Tropicimonas sp. IMCC6043]|uniref:hypothetical protein n=1 Tax=Tropicimonas sp. IMCC6043 TaxID=2510645 RepID=UPI00101C685E|nr:hypothetical protein [Tropicimonas sp. IMCC6043]RYH08524.1 hypothetical protein EU800_15875 [Tropicimonas sp. IMCC6043]